MIVTLTLNPAIDKTVSVDQMTATHKLRCKNITYEAGGGGINVSKALKELDCSSLAVFPAGGDSGQLLIRLLNKQHIATAVIDIAAPVREDLTVFDTSTELQYRLIMPGAPLTPAALHSCLTAVTNTVCQPDIVVASGSLPPDVPDSFFSLLSAALAPGGARLILDTSGAALGLALRETDVYLVKPSLTEFHQLCGYEPRTKEELADAAAKILAESRCFAIIISLGAAGALAISRDGALFVPAPVVNVKSTVGAGDSMTAGIAWMVQRNEDLLSITAFGVACGTAATLNPGTQLFKKNDVFSLFRQIKKEAQFIRTKN